MPLGALYQSLRGISTDISDQWNTQASLDEERRQADQLQGYRAESLALDQQQFDTQMAATTERNAATAKHEEYMRAYERRRALNEKNYRRDQTEIDRVNAETARAREARIARGEGMTMEPEPTRRASARKLLEELSESAAATMPDAELDQLIFRRSGGHFTSFDAAAAAASGRAPFGPRTPEAGGFQAAPGFTPTFNASPQVNWGSLGMPSPNDYRLSGPARGPNSSGALTDEDIDDFRRSRGR